MKNGLKSVGKAFLYFLVYLAAQSLVSNVFAAVASVQLTAEAMKTGQEIGIEEIVRLSNEWVLNMSTLIVILAGILALLIYWIAFMVRKKNFLAEVSVKKMDWKGILPIVVFGLTFNIAVSLFISMVPFPESWVNVYAENSSLLEAGNVLVNWIATVIMAPVVEETVFRGLVYGRLKKGMPALAAAIISAALFAIMHGTIIWGIYTFVFGMLAVWIFEKFRSLKANILFHMAFNLTGMLLGMLPELSDAVYWILCVAAVIIAAAAAIGIFKMKVVTENQAVEA